MNINTIPSEDSFYSEANMRRLEKADRPQAVFCDSDSIALEALRGLNDKGIRVPKMW